MRDASITEFFGDDYQDFRLGFGQLLELQEKTGVGPFRLYKRVMEEDWMLEDISEIIRVGLVGGGMKPKEAYNLVKRYVVERPPLENLTLARALILVALYGCPEEDKKKAKMKEEESDTDAKLSSRENYGYGAAMGYTPQDVNDMSLHQMRSAFEGFADFHNAKSGALTETEKDDLFAMVQDEMEKEA